MKISEQVIIPSSEIEIKAVRSTGSGGQNVNKVATAIHLRFDIRASSLPARYKAEIEGCCNEGQPSLICDF